jgi:putative membrane protein
VFFGGLWGLLVLLTSAALGVLTVSLGVRRTQCMAMLILPTILLYLKIT